MQSDPVARREDFSECVGQRAAHIVARAARSDEVAAAHEIEDLCDQLERSRDDAGVQNIYQYIMREREATLNIAAAPLCCPAWVQSSGSCCQKLSVVKCAQ